MVLVKDGVIAEDRWARIVDRRLPFGRPLLLTLAEWRDLGPTPSLWRQPLGLILESDASLEALADDLHRFQLIALSFAKFTDGRAFSLARLLRRRYGFTGELRAVGHVLRDQFVHMHRCGFDAVEVADETTARAWVAEVNRYAAFYQVAERGPHRATAPSFLAVAEAPAAAAWAY